MHNIIYIPIAIWLVIRKNNVYDGLCYIIMYVTGLIMGHKH